jgi:NADPH-dependent curcumin reductase CurA
VQLYKAAGWTVIGVAGSEDKCRWVEGLGAEVCLNYKMGREAFREKLEELTPDRIQQYFDNTGSLALSSCG